MLPSFFSFLFYWLPCLNRKKIWTGTLDGLQENEAFINLTTRLLAYTDVTFTQQQVKEAEKDVNVINEVIEEISRSYIFTILIAYFAWFLGTEKEEESMQHILNIA